MNTIAAVVLGLLMSTSAAFGDMSSSQAKWLTEAAAVVHDLRAIPEKGIPEDTWNRAECVAVIPGLKKTAFVIGGEFGKGVISCRSGQTWSAPVFLELQKGSAGFQVGAEQIDLALLMMNRQGVEKLLDNKVNLGADASVAAGPVGRAGSAGTDARLTAEILAYSRAQGLFAGLDLSGGVLRPEKDANAAAYGSAVTSRDVLFTNQVAAPQAAQVFLRTLRDETATSGKK